VNWIEKLARDSENGVTVCVGEAGGFRVSLIRRNKPSPGDETSANLHAVSQLNDEREGASSLARRRYQNGSLFLAGKSRRVWKLRWLDDVIQADGTIRRVHRSEVLGTLVEFPTRRLAERAREERLSLVNSPTYRARPTATFAQFAERWKANVLIHHKPSTQATIRSHFKKYLVPFFGEYQLRDVHPELIQRFLTGLKVSPKTVRNIYVSLQMVWKSAKAWRYVAHDALDGVVLPKQRKARRFFFTADEAQRILAASPEPQRTFLWIAAETGMRAGELCGLRLDDLDFERGLIHVRQSAWRGKLQDPKTENAIRTFALSPQLAAHLAAFVAKWRPNEWRLLFATRNRTPWDPNLLVKRKLHPLLDSLGITRCGLHAFRHTNSSLMDRLGAPLKVRQQRLGHSDPRLTLGVYTHVASEDDERIAGQLGEILSGIPCPNLPKCKNEGVTRIGQPLVN